jgi:hypothetical protein
MIVPKTKLHNLLFHSDPKHIYVHIVGWMSNVRLFSLSTLPLSRRSLSDIYSYTRFFFSFTYLAKAAYPFSLSLSCRFLSSYFFFVIESVAVDVDNVYIHIHVCYTST